MKIERPWLSVVIPTFNGDEYLVEALESVVAQQCDSLEVIAVDDGSTDRTLAILESFQDRLPLRIIRLAHCGNWVRNTNLGIAEARGEFISFLHQDDFWLPKRLERMRRVSEQFTDAAVLLHHSHFVDAKGRNVGRWQCPLPKTSNLIDPQIVFARLIVQNFISVSAPLIRRSALSAIGSLDESLWFVADWKLWLQLARIGPWFYLPQALSAFRLHSNSQTITGASQSSSYNDQYRRAQNEFLPLIESQHQLAAAARFSSETNILLASMFHNERLATGRFLRHALRLSPAGWYQFFRYSRILERVVARLRARLLQTRSPVLEPGRA